MKRIHLFEFEDFNWFPKWIRTCLTQLIVVMHNILNTHEELSELLAKQIKATDSTQILDLCSGSGGPMPKVIQILNEKHDLKDLQLTLTDLYPDTGTAEKMNADQDSNIRYNIEPIDATNIDSSKPGLRTMVGSFHHMNVDSAKKILASAVTSRQPICVFEISDNSFPALISWIALPINFIMCLFITPFVKPLTWQQLVFTYLIPIIPIFFAWDGAVSNLRTYTLSDLDTLLKDVPSENYKWEKGIIKGKSKKLYLLGTPV